MNDLPTKFTIFSFITIISFSGIVSTGMNYASTYSRYSNDTIEMVSWISENLPYKTRILIYDYWQITDTIETMTYCNGTLFESIFKEYYNPAKYEKRIDILKERQISFALINWRFLYYIPKYYNFCKNILIPEFYNRTVYIAGDLVLYFAPYFI